ncbi:FAD-dependent protein, partial [Streptococcus gordonii]
FCMCPGGSVVPSASMEGGVVVNGMSEHARDQENANSALLVQIRPEDYGEHALDGIAYQEALERKAFQMGGGNYRAPAQRVEDFLKHKASQAMGSVKPS